MREFVVVAHEVPVDGGFSLDALGSEGGRMDLVARCVNAGLLASHGIREDVRVHVVVGDAFTVRVDGGSVRNLHPDERSIAALLRSALRARADAIGRMPAEPSPGVSVFRMGFAETIRDLAEGGTVVQLHEDGEPAGDVVPPSDPVIVLSDHLDFTSAEGAVLEDVGAVRLRFGPRTLHADHAISVAQQFCDTDGYESF